MKKKSMRIASAMLAACMMVSMLPLNTFALDTGAAQADDVSVQADGEVAIDATNFPDSVFRQYVKDTFDTDGSGTFSETEIAKATNIRVSNKSIGSLTGIEHFTALTHLTCNGNNLSELDVSKNTALTYMQCSENNLSGLNVSNNPKLTYLYCEENGLSELNVSSNPDLVFLWCDGNKLSQLDVSGQAELKSLYCYDNQLTSLALGSNKQKLEKVECSNNQLTALDVSSCTNLKELICFKNQITSLDVSNNKELTDLSFGSNQLTELDLSNNTKLQFLYCWGNRLTSLDLSKTVVVNETLDEVDYFDPWYNKYEIKLSADNTFDLSTLPGNFDAAKASQWTNGTVNGTTLTVTDPEQNVTYIYDTNYTYKDEKVTVEFRLIPSKSTAPDPDVPADPDTPEGAGRAGGVVAAVTLGAAAVWGVYEAGTGIYRVLNMKGISMPANRGELAMLIWERAGKPEPESTALYDDIDADDTDLQKAARWMVEQELLDDEEENNKFYPGFIVTKLRTCTTWEKAKQKGLFD